ESEEWLVDYGFVQQLQDSVVVGLVLPCGQQTPLDSSLHAIPGKDTAQSLDFFPRDRRRQRLDRLPLTSLARRRSRRAGERDQLRFSFVSASDLDAVDQAGDLAARLEAARRRCVASEVTQAHLGNLAVGHAAGLQQSNRLR